MSCVVVLGRVVYIFMSHAQSECCCVTGVGVLRNKNDVSIFMSLVHVFVQMLLLFSARWSGVYREVYAIA